MKIKKYFVLILFCTAFNAQAFEAVKLDEAVLGFLNKEWGYQCADIEYSYIYALRVDIAYERGFYVEGWKPSDFNPPELPTDILVEFEASICDDTIITNRDKYRLDYIYNMTLRKDSSGSYKIIRHYYTY